VSVVHGGLHTFPALLHDEAKFYIISGRLDGYARPVSVRDMQGPPCQGLVR
jgi:hypothetical protein